MIDGRKAEEMNSGKEALSGKRASVLQVAKLMFFGLLMIGSKGTWEKGGEAARLTSGQIVVGAVIGGLVVIAALIGLVKMALSA